MRQLFKDIGMDFNTMVINEPVKVDGWEVQTIDKNNDIVWKKVVHVVRKSNAPHMRVFTDSGLVLDCSPDHRLFVESNQTGVQTYQEIYVLEKAFEAFKVRTSNGWESFRVEAIAGDLEIADIEVEGEHSYLSNGILSHNTLYGDPSCVSPDTNLVVRRSVNQIKTSEMIKFAELFNRFGVDKFDTPLEIDTSSDEYEIESWDEKTKQIVWKPITALVVKPSVEKHYKLGSLKGTSVHRVLHNGEWVELQNHPDATLVEEAIPVVDMMVEDTENYLAEGQINHNTTPGGMAIPYHASTRIKLTGGQQIKQTINGKEAVVGINVTCKTIKNKVARPWREVSFEIHFGKGIREDEQIFDELREYCEKCKDIVIVNGMKVKVHGGGAWKYFTVSDNSTGEVIHDITFNKSAFREKVINNPEVQVYLTGLMDAAFIMGNGDDNHKTIASIDLNSATEVEAVKVERTVKAGKNLLLD